MFQRLLTRNISYFEAPETTPLYLTTLMHRDPITLNNALGESSREYTTSYHITSRYDPVTEMCPPVLVPFCAEYCRSPISCTLIYFEAIPKENCRIFESLHICRKLLIQVYQLYFALHQSPIWSCKSLPFIAPQQDIYLLPMCSALGSFP
jgi:hypothetical protein